MPLNASLCDTSGIVVVDKRMALSLFLSSITRVAIKLASWSSIRLLKVTIYNKEKIGTYKTNSSFFHFGELVNFVGVPLNSSGFTARTNLIVPAIEKNKTRKGEEE